MKSASILGASKKIAKLDFSVLLLLGIILAAIFMPLHKLIAAHGYENYAFALLSIGLFLVTVSVFKLRAKISDRLFTCMLFAGVALALALPPLSLSLNELLGGIGSYGIYQYFLLGLATLLIAFGLFGVYDRKPLMLLTLGAFVSSVVGARYSTNEALSWFFYTVIVLTTIFYLIHWGCFAPERLATNPAQALSIAIIALFGLVLALHELLLPRNVWSVGFFVLVLYSSPLLIFSILLLHKPELHWLKENYFVVGVMIFLVLSAFFLRTYFNFEPATGRGFSWVGTDPYYYGRIVENIVAKKSHLTYDELINYPSLGTNPRPPMFGWFSSVLGLLFTPLFNGDSYTSALWALSIAPALWGALTVIPIYYLGKELFNSRKVGIIAALLLAIMPDHIQGTGFGLSDHDPFYMFFIVVAFFFLVKALKSLNEKKWVSSWRKPKDIKLGLKECIRNNKTAIGWSALAAFSMLTVMLTWEGYVYVFGILLIYYLVQLVINHIRHEDSLALSLVVLTTVIIPAILSPISAPYYLGITLTGVLQGAIPWIWYFLIAFLLLSILFVPTRDLPWVIFLPSLILVGTVGYFALQHFLPGIASTLLGGMGYIIKTKVYGTIGEAQATDLNRCVFGYGIITFYLTLVALFILIIHYIKSWKKDKLLISVWGATAIWMTLSAVRFMFNAVPIYAVLPAWLIYEIIKKLDFRTMHKNVYAMRYEKLRALRKGMKLKHVACVLFVVFSVMLPNAWGAIDAGIPYEKKGYYDKMIYDWLPSWLKKESYVGLQYLGTHGQSYLADYWFHGLKWLSTQDTELPIERRPAFIAWWDYGFQCVQDGRHPTIADNFQNGIPPAGNFITAQNETRAIAVFITRILHAQRTREGKLSDEVKATLSEYLDEENALKLENIITNPDYYLSEVLGNFDKCHKRTYDIADRQHNIGLHSENTMYAAAMVFFAEFDDALLVKLLHELEALTGHSIRYFAADQRMFPFNWANTGIYYAPTVLSDQDVNEFFEILIQGEVVDRKGDRVGDPTGFMTAEEFSEWRERMLERYTREYTPRALAYKLKYKEPFFKSMFYRAYIGYSGLDVGMDIDTFGIPGIHPELSGRPDWLATQHNLLPMPGWMQKHFRAVYINPGLRIMKYYEGANITGRVATEENKPVSNVHVTVIDDLGIPHDRVLTDSEGYFKLTAPFGMPENNYTVTIVASIGELDELGEKITQTSNSQLNTTTLRITYEEAREMKSIELNFTVKSCSLSGNAVWDDDESAISNCTAILRKGDKNFTNITLQDGYYEFKGLPPGTYQVFLNLSSTLRELDIAKSLEFSLPGESKTEELRVKPCTVNYTIYYDNNTIANASCSLCDLTNNTYYNETAVNGSFKVNKLLPGRYNITIYQPGYLKSEESFELLYGELRNKTITLYSSSKINGTAYIANKSKPATYAAIRFKNLETNKAEKTVTCENGSYEIELKCGRYSVSALHTDENVTWIYHALVVFNESYYMHDICLEQAAKLYGKVLLEGNGASGALVNFTSDSYNLTIKSNSTGYYEAYLSEGNYTIIAHHTFNESTFVHCERVSISAGAYLNRDLKLVEGVKVYGIVHYDVDETKDKPIRNLVLKFSSENGTLETTNLENYNVYLIGNRTYNIELDFSNADFKEDCFNLTLFNRTLYVTETRNESTDRLETLEHNIFLKPKNASLILNITCEKPVAGLNITIFLNATDDVALSTNITLNITAEAINYTFELNPGNYYIAVNYSSIKNEALIRYCYNESFNIELGTNETYHNITLEKELKVNGTVWLNTTDENRTLPNITLEFKLIDGTWDTTVLVDENASYEVWLKERNYSIFAEYILENITYQNGNATYQNITYLCLDSLNVSKHNYTKNITLVKAWEVNGTVYWAENETVKESVTLTFLHVVSNITRNASVENGNYTILLLPGKYQVIVNHTEERDYGNLTYTCEELLAVSQNKFYNISVNREIVIKLRGLAKYKDTDGKEQVIKNIELLITNTTSNITYNTTTDQNGNYIIYLAPGEYNISAKRAGFEFFSTIFNVGIQNYEKDLYLSITNITLVGFTYYDENMNNVFEPGDFVIPNVEIEFISKELKVKSNATGFYNTSLQFGLYDIHVFYATAWGDAYGALDKLEITPDNITAEGEYLRNISMTRCFRVYGIGYYYNLTGIYKQASQNNISQIVNISINELKNITLDVEGCYQIILPKGEHRFRANITTFEYNMNVTYTCDEVINLTKTFEFNLNFTIPANATLTWNESELATISQNETTQYNITIMNTGNLEDTFVLGFEPPEELGEGWKAEFNISNITLKPREVGSFMVNVTSGTRAKAGNNTVKITATSGRDVTRKASVDTVVNIKQLYGFNIKCAEFEKGIHWNYTNSTTYSIKVFNEGNGIDSVNFSLENIPLSWNASLDKDSVIFQKGYDEQEIKLTVTSPLNASVGERATIKIIGKSYWEDGSQRNISALNVTAIVSLPDLAITKIALSNSHPAPNETVTVNITVENLAIVDAKVEGDFKLNFYANGELINTTTVPELAAKQNITFSFNWTTPTSSGWYNLRADVLPANENVTFDELDKGNNAVTIRVLVGEEITYWRVIAFVLGIATFIIALAIWRRIRRRR